MGRTRKGSHRDDGGDEDTAVGWGSKHPRGSVLMDLRKGNRGIRVRVGLRKGNLEACGSGAASEGYERQWKEKFLLMATEGRICKHIVALLRLFLGQHTKSWV